MREPTDITRVIARLWCHTARLCPNGFCCGMLFLLVLTGCRIEPPLRLPEQKDIQIMMPEVITDFDLIWEVDYDWRKVWYYGWDADDITRWGKLEYPEPSNYEIRIYYKGMEAIPGWVDLERTTIYGKSMRKKFSFGFHDMLIWSNVDSPDGTESLIINEDNPASIVATTSRSRVSYAPPASRSLDVYNNPDIFYSGRDPNIYISDNLEDYDYFEESTNTWIKQLEMKLYPLVYMYLVQVVMYNNNGRVTGPSDRITVSNMAESVNVHTGHTSVNEVTVAYEGRQKNGLPAREGRLADIIGGKLTTFGLCDMERWSSGRGTTYKGSRTELQNNLMVNLHFNNSTDSTYVYDITPQLQRQVHGGVVTIEIDVDTLKVPHRSDPTSAGFDPVVAPRDTVEHVFDM